jgi:hypothetical protein
MRRGVFARAVKKTSRLHPEFVMSVGDLIDGYTTSPRVWKQQWRNVDSLLQGFDVPFFYLAGNHDISNATLERVWKERLGATYYHFTYRDVLFLCLNTEQRSGGGLSPEQIQYFRRVINEHTDVRWTLVFMHRPLWMYDDPGGFAAFDSLLAGRPYTSFAGHHHHYRTARHETGRHYLLGTTGGGSALRGTQVGEFDHVTWVTVPPSGGPSVAHLTLDGIVSDRVVSERDYSAVAHLRQGKWLTVDPIIHSDSAFTELRTSLRLRNPVDRPLHVEGALQQRRGLRFWPDSINTVVPAQDTTTVPLTVQSHGPTSVAAYRKHPPLNVTLQGTYEGLSQRRSLTASAPLVLDAPRPLRERRLGVLVNGYANEWRSMINVTQPGHVDEAWAWRGPRDARFRFNLARARDSLYAVFEIIDDQPRAVSGRQTPDSNTVSEKLKLYFDARPSDRRRSRPVPPSPLSITIHPGKSSDVASVSGIDSKRVHVASRRRHNGYVVEAAFPVDYLREQQGRSWSSLRFNVGVMDQDRPSNAKPPTLWWHPPWSRPSSHPEFGTFVRTPMP